MNVVEIGYDFGFVFIVVFVVFLDILVVNLCVFSVGY